MSLQRDNGGLEAISVPIAENNEDENDTVLRNCATEESRESCAESEEKVSEPDDFSVAFRARDILTAQNGGKRLGKDHWESHQCRFDW